MSEQKVNVEIDGITYTLIADENEQRIKELAHYVDQKIKEIKENKLSYDRQLVLTSINIADDLFKLAEEFKNLRDTNREAMENYPKLIEEHERLSLDNDELTDRYEKLKEKNQNQEDRINQLNNELKRAEDEDRSITKLRNEIKTLQQEIMTLQSENDTLKGQI